MKRKRTATTTVSVKPALVYEIVSDYAAYARWLPGLKSSRVLAEEGNFAIVELEFAANPGVPLTVECIHAPTSMVVLRSLTGNKPRVAIRWAIAAAGSGEAQVTFKVEGPLSQAFFPGTHKGFFDPDKGLAALQGVLASAGDGPSGEKIIEIVETEEGLFCLYRGTRYRMEASS